MGTDIHLYVEKRNTDGTWSAVKIPYSGWAGGEKYHDGYRGWSDRSDDTFAILADVRNGRGFAGVVTGDGFNIIAEPRGIPDDISDTLKPVDRDEEEEESDERRPWIGDHSFSWLTYSEIVGFDWTQTTHRQGVVGATEYAEFKKNGRPTSWSGRVWGRDVVHATDEEMDAWLRGDGILTSVRWQVSYSEVAAPFLRWLNKVVKPIADVVGGDNVRLVFGFDS